MRRPRMAVDQRLTLARFRGTGPHVRDGADRLDLRETLPLRPWYPPKPRRVSVEAMFESTTHPHSTADPLVLPPTPTPDLFVIGPCGRGAPRRLALGSTAETMMGQSMAPVVIARDTHEARTIAVCIDGSEACSRPLGS